MQIVPFESANLPATAELSRRFLSINADVATAAAFPTMSIKGKIFAIVKDGTRTQLTKADDDGEVIPIAAISVSVLRANLKARVYYEDTYDEDASTGAKPTCYTHDGVTPAPDAESPQAKKCQLCPHAVWGSKTGDLDSGKGTSCSPNARLAICAPDKPSEPMLLRVPPASIKPFREAVKLGEARQLPYNQLVFRVGFDREATSPKLTFKPVGLLAGADYDAICEMYENETVQQIVGVHPVIEAPAKAAKDEGSDELDAALKAAEAEKVAAAKAKAAEEAAIGKAAQEADETAKAAAEAKAAKAAKAKAKAEKDAADAAAAKAAAAKEEDAGETAVTKPQSTVSVDAGGLLGELDSLLGGLDDN